MKSFILQNTVKLSTHHRQRSGPYHLANLSYPRIASNSFRFFGDYLVDFGSSSRRADLSDNPQGAKILV